MLKEFKEFATRGNIFDMAIGIIIGGAFQKIVTSLVNDIVMPTISIITGKVDFSTLEFTIGDISIKYGNFITSIIDFLIIAFSIFIAIRSANKINKKLADTAKGNFEKISKKNKEKLEELSKKSKLFKKKEKEEEPAPEPTTKTCPFCYTEINFKATRCPNCTSDLKYVKYLYKKKNQTFRFYPISLGHFLIKYI